jgi:hypothetical protein
MTNVVRDSTINIMMQKMISLRERERGIPKQQNSTLSSCSSKFEFAER